MTAKCTQLVGSWSNIKPCGRPAKWAWTTTSPNQITGQKTTLKRCGLHAKRRPDHAIRLDAKPE